MIILSEGIAEALGIFSLNRGRQALQPIPKHKSAIINTFYTKTRKGLIVNSEIQLFGKSDFEDGLVTKLIMKPTIIESSICIEQI